MPDSNPFYDLLGGYYPGEPIPKTRPYGRYAEPREFNSDILVDDYLSAVQKELDKVGVSEQVKKLFIKDVERSLRARTVVKKTPYDPMRVMELGDEEDIAGVQIDVDINPINWLKDPAGMAKETIENWGKDFLNWSDYSSYVERTKLWRPLLYGEETLPGIDYAYREGSGELPSDKPKPFQLKNLGITTNKEEAYYSPRLERAALRRKPKAKQKESLEVSVEREVDLFSDSADSFLNFSSTVRAHGARNKVLRDFAGQAALASSAELISLLESGKIADSTDVTTIKSYLHRARVLRAANSLVEKGDSSNYIFSRGGEFSDFGHGVGAGLGSISDDLQKHSLGKLRGGAEGLSGTIAKVVGTEKDPKNCSLFRIEKTIEEARAYFGGISPTALAEFDRDIKPLTNCLEEVKRLKDVGVIDSLGAKNLKGKVDLIMEKFSREGPIKGGLDSMNRKFLETHLLHGPLRAVITDPKNDVIVGSRNLIQVAEEVLRTYKREDFYDLVNTLESQGMLGVAGDLVWNLARKRLNGFTPAAIITEELKKRHYFGLIYDPNYGPDAEKGSKFVNNIISNSKLFDNWHTVDVEISGSVRKFKFIGDKKLEFGTDLYSRRLVKGALHIPREEFVDFLNCSEKKYGKLVKAGKMTTMLYRKDLKDAARDSKELRSWLKIYGHQLGLEFDNAGLLVNSPENAIKLEALFKSLGEYEGRAKGVGIFQSKAGILQKLSKKLNVWQEKMFGWFLKTSLGKIVSAPAYLREVIAKSASKVIYSALAKAIGGAVAVGTEGIGAIIMPIIEKTVQYLLNKAEDFFKKFIKSVSEGGFGVVESFLEASFRTTAKAAGMFLSIFSIGCMTPVLIIFMLILTAITPIDPTRMASGEDVGGGPAAGPPRVCPPGVCEVISTVGCFEFLEGWDSGEGPQALGIIQNAANHLSSNHGRFVNRLCLNGTVEVAWNPGASCGWASGVNRIEFGDGQCWSYVAGNQNLFNYLFAHESGHIYAHRYGMGALGTAQSIDGGKTLPTYVGPTGAACSTGNNSSEDFAETVGQYVVLSGQCTDVDYGAFWAAWPGHWSFATSSFLFGP